MSLRNALLALLRIGPLSGYELQKQFSQSVGHVWHAPDSQIYPELRKMVDEGLIVPEEQIRGTVGIRRVYHVTDRGKESFFAWLSEPVKYQRTRDSSHLKAAYLESADPEERLAFFRDHVEHWSTELTCWEEEIGKIDALTSPMLARRLSLTPDEDHAAAIAYKRFAYEGLAARARSEIEWAERGMHLSRILSGELGAPSPQAPGGRSRSEPPTAHSAGQGPESPPAPAGVSDSSQAPRASPGRSRRGLSSRT